MKKSAYSMAPNRVICPYCQRPFPWTSSLRRHILTHTGQKPYQCVHCLLLFTTKSNCDRHLLRKHKANSTKNRRRRTTSSPEVEETSTKIKNNNNNTNNNNNNSTSNNNNNNNNNTTFLMRNVPERPYKCSKCPSSTFSTLGNLRKHCATKHFLGDEKSSSPDSPISESQSEQRNSPLPIIKQQNTDQSDCESPLSSASEINETTTSVNARALNSTPSTSTNGGNGRPRSRRPSPRSSPGPSDAPFKCHLCDSSFSERQDCLNHIKDNHKYCYKMLVAKGALKMDTENIDDLPMQQQHHSDGDERRGKFPDYSSRKVVCAFCMRRFWSAEDLRRHMRTHSGERPFKCDVCKREFTLKHSMLRHRKKHESEGNLTMCGGTSGEEESTRTQSPTIITPRSQQQVIYTSTNNHGERNSLPTMATVATGDAAPSGLMRFNPYENLATMTGQLNQSNIQTNSNHDTTPDNDNDLISNLLGIRDRSIIDRVLQASADDAAKLLGVNRSHD